MGLEGLKRLIPAMIRSAGMLVVGLTGGIGSGKSTVASLLAGLGAEVIDTDVIARQVVAPGGPAHSDLLARFGADLAGDRARLADVVFGDPGALADLNAIVHPRVRAAVRARLEEASTRAEPPEAVVVVIPLLAEGGRDNYELDRVMVVDLPLEMALERLVEGRGMSADDARRRMAAQAPREQRRAIADVVIPNTGTLDDLVAEVDRAWRDLTRSPGPPS